MSSMRNNNCASDNAGSSGRSAGGRRRSRRGRGTPERPWCRPRSRNGDERRRPPSAAGHGGAGKRPAEGLPSQARATIPCALILCCLAGCAAPEYAIRPTPVPIESPNVTQLERAISNEQAKLFERHRAWQPRRGQRLWGFDLQAIIDRISRVTERPNLPYRVIVTEDRDPNAAALADGRVYITSGMLNYLASRGSREGELAAIVGHELGHTAAQHLIKRMQMIQQRELIGTLVGVGTSLATRGASSQVGSILNDAVSLVNQTAISGYSQEQELEADQLGVRYMMRAGYDPHDALNLLDDFTRFESGGPMIAIRGVPVPAPFLRTHPYTSLRRAYLARYLNESRVADKPASTASTDLDEARRRLREAQKLYPPTSQSWRNLQRQLDALDRTPAR